MGSSSGPLQRPAARTKNPKIEKTSGPETVISRELSLSEWAKQDADEEPFSRTEAPSTSGEHDGAQSWVNTLKTYLAKSNRKKRELRCKLHEAGFLQIAEETLTFWGKLWHYVFVDPYERVNVWSHGLGALFFFVYAIWGRVGWLFPMCAAATHLLSVGAHIYPGSLLTEKMDHLGIVFLIVGTPLSIDEALGWRLGGRPYAKYIAPVIGSAAVLPDEPRVVGFVAGSAALLGVYKHLLLEVVSGREPFSLGQIMIAELVLYLSVAYLFLKSGNYHRSKWALADHHIAHYCVTIASVLHLVWLHYIRATSVQDFDELAR